jgi:hypothetical protein
MHARNGRELHNGDKIVAFHMDTARIEGVGILTDAVPGNDYCNGHVAKPGGGTVCLACLCDCLHEDDLAAILKEKGLDKRPSGK